MALARSTTQHKFASIRDGIEDNKRRAATDEPLLHRMSKQTINDGYLTYLRQIWAMPQQTSRPPPTSLRLSASPAGNEAILPMRLGALSARRS